MSLPSWCGRAAAVVLTTCGLAQDDLTTRINQALEDARPALLGHLQEAADRSTRAGELALVLLAAIHDGVPVTDKLMVAAMKSLAAAKPDQTYDVALRLMVLEACAEFPDRLKLAKADGKTLLEHRNNNGTFQYMRRPAGWDLSNTQYGALGLRAAAALGVTVERSVWSKLAAEVGEQQDSYGGFGYHTRHGNEQLGYASMTAAGIAVLAICQQALGEDPDPKKPLQQRINRGWQWFVTNSQTIGSPRERWSYYFHYGLERAAILTDVKTLANGVDWYAVGARMLVDAQEAGGGWRSQTDGYPGGQLSGGRGASVPTSFAILFLRRMFKKVVAPITPHVVTLASLGAKSKDADVEACAAELLRRGKAAMTDIVKGLRGEHATQRRAASQALAGIAGDTFGFDPALDQDGNRDAVHKAELWFLRNR